MAIVGVDGVRWRVTREGEHFFQSKTSLLLIFRLKMSHRVHGHVHGGVRKETDEGPEFKRSQMFLKSRFLYMVLDSLKKVSLTFISFNFLLELCGFDQSGIFKGQWWWLSW